MTGIAGVAPYWVCPTCKLSAVSNEDLANYPCQPDRYDAVDGQGQPEQLRNERIAWEILRLGNGNDVTVPDSRAMLPSEARNWLERVEERSEPINGQPEDEKLRIATQYAEEPWEEEYPE